MATVVIPVLSVKGPQVAASSAGASVTSSDTATVVPGRGLTLALVNASTATTATIAAGKAAALTITVAASKTTYFKLSDSYYYEQTDGTIHITVAATVTATAITR